MSFSEIRRAEQSTAHPAHRDFTITDTDLLEKIVKHVLELPSGDKSKAEPAPNAADAPSRKSNRNPYLGWARCPTFSIPPAVAQKMAVSWTGTETYEGFFSKLESSRKAPSLTSPVAAAAGGSYYRRNYDSQASKAPQSQPYRPEVVAPAALAPCDTSQSANGRRIEDGTVDPRLVCPSPSPTSYINVSYSSSAPTKKTQKPLPGFEISAAENELIKLFPNYAQSIKIIPAIIFCNRCKHEIPTNIEAITQHATIHLINPKENPHKFGCLVGNCWRRLPIAQIGNHVASHFKASSASCGMCGLVFPSPASARNHLVSSCSELQDV